MLENLGEFSDDLGADGGGGFAAFSATQNLTKQIQILIVWRQRIRVEFAPLDAFASKLLS
jgi:hypothetical protein